MRPSWVLVVVAAAAGLAACSRGHDASSDTMRPPAVTASPSAPSGQAATTSSLPGGPGLLAPATATSSADVPATANRATVVIGVPALPADLDAARSPAVAGGRSDHDDHDHVGPPSDSDVAAAWVVALYTGRFDDPAGIVEAELSALADPSVVDAAVPSIPPLDAELVEARWPIITAVNSTGDGWWRVDYVLKRIVTGHVGPSTSNPASVDVHVVAGRVDDWHTVEVAP